MGTNATTGSAHVLHFANGAAQDDTKSERTKKSTPEKKTTYTNSVSVEAGILVARIYENWTKNAKEELWTFPMVLIILNES